MSHEKMQILKMLESGKISADEAARLLAAAEDGNSKHGHANRQSPPGNDRQTGQEWSREFGKKIEDLAKDMEPRIKEITETVVEKTMEFADKFSKGVPSGQASSGKSKTYGKMGNVKEFTLPVKEGGMNELALFSIDSPLEIKGYNGDKITIKVTYQSKGGRSDVSLMQLGGRYYLDCDTSAVHRLSVEGYIPSHLFDRIQLQSQNGVLSLDNIESKIVEIKAKSSEVLVSKAVFDKMDIHMSDGRARLQHLEGKKLVLENANGAIQAGHLDVSAIKFETDNGEIDFTGSPSMKNSAYNWNMVTSNSPIKLNLPVMPETGYDFTAYTSLNKIAIGLTGLNYLNHNDNFVEAKSISFDSDSRKVKIAMETSNAPILVN